MNSHSIRSAQQLCDTFDDLLAADEENAHVWLLSTFQELHEIAVSREDDEATVRAAEILCDLANLSEAEHAFSIGSNGILTPSPKTLQARAAAVCKRLAECRELAAVGRI